MTNRNGITECMDCGRDTTPHDDDLNPTGLWEYYMLRTDLWLTINPRGVGMLCIGCAEDRLGRTLIPDDFTDCPLNEWWGSFPHSPRLVSRLRGG